MRGKASGEGRGEEPAYLGRVPHVPHENAAVGKRTHGPLAVRCDAHNNGIRPRCLRSLLPDIAPALEGGRLRERADVLEGRRVEHSHEAVAARARYEAVRCGEGVDGLALEVHPLFKHSCDAEGSETFQPQGEQQGEGISGTHGCCRSREGIRRRRGRMSQASLLRSC